MTAYNIVTIIVIHQNINTTNIDRLILILLSIDNYIQCQGQEQHTASEKNKRTKGGLCTNLCVCVCGFVCCMCDSVCVCVCACVCVRIHDIHVLSIFSLFDPTTRTHTHNTRTVRNSRQQPSCRISRGSAPGSVRSH